MRPSCLPEPDNLALKVSASDNPESCGVAFESDAPSDSPEMMRSILDSSAWQFAPPAAVAADVPVARADSPRGLLRATGDELPAAEAGDELSLAARVRAASFLAAAVADEWSLTNKCSLSERMIQR
uniref:Uncharacterized protein n=1 Tax=Peronospora matthiolae TaxID=2874970 RepID=A0AAV1U198_9STRA